MNKPQQQEKMIRRFMMNTHGLAEEVDSHTRSCAISVKKIQAGGCAGLLELTFHGHLHPREKQTDKKH
jgi:hypothetical protein